MAIPLTFMLWAKLLTKELSTALSTFQLPSFALLANRGSALKVSMIMWSFSNLTLCSASSSSSEHTKEQLGKYKIN